MRLISGKLLTVLALLSVAACQTTSPTPYQPETGAYGYSEEKLDEHRYLVSFQGNSSTPYAMVEDYLLYRAAELAQSEGAESFAVIAGPDPEVKIHSETDKTVCEYSPVSFSAFVYYPEEDTEPASARTSYKASIEILLGQDEPASEDQMVFKTSQTLDVMSSCVGAPDAE